MSALPGLFPPIPNDPVSVAEAATGKGIYLTLGDQIEELLAQVELARLDPVGRQSTTTLALLALVTVFQFSEGLPDHQAAAATRLRADWKYALHLSRSYRGLDYRLLCEFRRTLLYDSSAQQIFQQILDRLAGTELLSNIDKQLLTAHEVLTVICRASQLEQLVEAMQLVLEAMAAVAPEVLRTITLPHWYERYSQLQAVRNLPKLQEEQIAWARAVGADAAYLLEAIAQAGDPLRSLSETHTLQQVWTCQFEPVGSSWHWRASVCTACSQQYLNEPNSGLDRLQRGTSP